MHKTLVIAVREYNAAVRTKAFLISIVVVPIFMFGTMIAIKLLEDQVDTSDKRIAVIDRSGLVVGALAAAAEERNRNSITDPETNERIRPAYVIESVTAGDDALAQRLQLSDRVRNKDLHAFVEIGPDVIAPNPDEPDRSRIAYCAENAAIDSIHRWLSGPLNDRIRALRLAETDIDQATVNRLTKYMPVETMGLVSVDASGAVRDAEHASKEAAFFPPMVMMMLMFMLVMMGAQPLLQSVLEEKMQRIAEVLLGSARPFELMMGKLLGTVGVSLTIMGVYVGGGYLIAQQAGFAEHIPLHVLPWFFVYQISAVFMFGAMYIAVGAACNDLKEAQSLMMPVMMVVMLPMFVWFHVLREPLSTFATWISLFPPCTPMLMLIRQATSAAIPVWQPWAGLAGVLGFTVFSVWAAGRVFRVGLLMQGKPPKIQDLFRWAIQG